jgi:type II secretory pathway component PulM
MVDPLQAFSRLNEREQRIVGFGAAAAVVLLILAVFIPLQRNVSAGAQRIERKRADLAWLQSVAPELNGLAVSAPAPLHESLVALVDRTAREAGLGKSLVGSQPSGNGGLNTRFEQVSFDQLASWLSQLNERYGISAQSATIDAAGMPGIVNASLVLHAR